MSSLSVPGVELGLPGSRSIFSFCRQREVPAQADSRNQPGGHRGSAGRGNFSHIESWSCVVFLVLSRNTNRYLLSWVLSPPAIFHTKETNILRLFTIWNLFEIKILQQIAELSSPEKHKHYGYISVLAIWIFLAGTIWLLQDLLSGQIW